MAQKKKHAEDLRVLRTRKALMQALIELTVEKGFVELTVQDIADRAMVNRATFYRHYLDKYDLLEKYMDEIYELTASQEQQPSAYMSSVGIANPPVGMTRMLERVQQHADFFRAMLGAKGDLAFARKIQQYSEKRLRSLLQSGRAESKLPLELCLNYLGHAGIGAIEWWLKLGQAYSPEQMAAWLQLLNTATVKHILDANEP